MHLDTSTQGEVTGLSPQNLPQPQTGVLMGPVHSYDIPSREQLQHTQTKELLVSKNPIRTAKLMLVVCALLLAPLLANAEYEFHRNAVPSSQLLSAESLVSSGADRWTSAFAGGGSISRRHATSIMWLHR